MTRRRLLRPAGTPLLLADRTKEGRTAGLGDPARSSRRSAAAGRASLRGRRPRTHAGNSRVRRPPGDDRARSSPPASIASSSTSWMACASAAAARVGPPPALARTLAGRRGEAGRGKAPRKRRYCRGRRCASGRAAPPSAARANPRTASPDELRRIPGPSGSSPRPASRGWPSSASVCDEVHEAEAARVVVGDDLAVIQMQDDVVVLRVLRALVMERAGAMASAASMRNEPDMPRWAISVSPLSSLKQKIFRAARKRDDLPSRQPLARSRAGRESGCPPRRSSTFRIRAPTIAGSRPRRTVSTSGSSGIAMIPDDSEKGRAVFLQLDRADAMQAREARRACPAAPSPFRSASGQGR